MASVIFDFDSTLITVESLEKILSESLANRPNTMAAIEAITAKGMEGTLSFAESLSQRLALAAPSHADVVRFGNSAKEFLTPGFADVIQKLHARAVDVRIVSGGLAEAILPLAGTLGIAPSKVHAVQLRWAEDGSFSGIDPTDAFSHSKGAGFRNLVDQLQRPVVVVGDGMTDYELFGAGLADAFIAFTGNVRRAPVVKVANHVAESAQDLQTLLESWL